MQSDISLNTLERDLCNLFIHQPYNKTADGKYVYDTIFDKYWRLSNKDGELAYQDCYDTTFGSGLMLVDNHVSLADSTGAPLAGVEVKSELRYKTRDDSALRSSNLNFVTDGAG